MVEPVRPWPTGGVGYGEKPTTPRPDQTGDQVRLVYPGSKRLIERLDRERAILIDAFTGIGECIIGVPKRQEQQMVERAFPNPPPPTSGNPNVAIGTNALRACQGLPPLPKREDCPACKGSGAGVFKAGGNVALEECRHCLSPRPEPPKRWHCECGFPWNYAADRPRQHSDNCLRCISERWRTRPGHLRTTIGWWYLRRCYRICRAAGMGSWLVFGGRR